MAGPPVADLFQTSLMAMTDWKNDPGGGGVNIGIYCCEEREKGGERGGAGCPYKVNGEMIAQTQIDTQQQYGVPTDYLMSC